MTDDGPRLNGVRSSLKELTGWAQSIRKLLLGFLFLLGLLVFPWLLAVKWPGFVLVAALGLYLLEAAVMVAVRRLAQALRRRRFGELPPQGPIGLVDVTLTTAACLLGVPLFGWLAFVYHRDQTETRIFILVAVIPFLLLARLVWDCYRYATRE